MAAESVTTSSAAVVQPVRARVKSTSSLQQPVVAQHFAIPPPASVPSSRRSISSLSSTPPTPHSVDTLMPACPTGWARFDLSPLNEVTQDASSSADHQTTASELPAETSSDAEPKADDCQTQNFATFPSLSVQDDQDTEKPAVTEAQMSNNKFSDSFLASRDETSCDDAVKQDDSVVVSSSFELMSPSSDKDSISLPSPEVPPPPLPENVVTTELPSEPPVPPPRPRVQVGHGVEHSAGPVTPSSTRSDSVHSSPVLPPTTEESPAIKPPATVDSTAVVSNHSQHITSSSDTTSRFIVQPSSARSSVHDHVLFPLSFPADDATPPPLPPRNIPASVDVQKQQLMRGTSLPASGNIHSVNSVPPPPPPRRSLSKPVTSSQRVDPFAPIPVSIPVSSTPAKQSAVAAAPFFTSSSVVETTIAPLPRPRPQLRQTQIVTTEAVSDAVVTTSLSPWQSVNTPPLIGTVLDPFSNVDPFAGSVSPDDPFAEPSLDGMLSDLCHDFDSDTLSTTAFRTRAVTIDSVSSDVYEADAAGSSAHRWETSSVSSESHFSNHRNAADVSPVVLRTAPTLNTDAVGTGCLVDLNTADVHSTGDVKWQPFADRPTAASGSQPVSGSALFGDLEDVWCSSGSVDWKPASSATLLSSNMFDSSASSEAVHQLDSASAQVSDVQQVVSNLDTRPSDVVVCQAETHSCAEDVSVISQVVTSSQTSHCSLQSLSVTSSLCTTDQHSTTDFADISSHLLRAVSEPPGPSQVTSSIEHRNSSFDAVFGQRFTSAVTSTASTGMSVITDADTAVSNAVTSLQSTVNNVQHDGSSADLPASDVQVSC